MIYLEQAQIIQAQVSERPQPGQVEGYFTLPGPSNSGSVFHFNGSI